MPKITLAGAVTIVLIAAPLAAQLPLPSSNAKVRAALDQLDPIWDELFPAEQARIVQLLVERVDVQEEGVDIWLRIDGLASLVEEFNGAREAA